jgi:hypothetical protein
MSAIFKDKKMTRTLRQDIKDTLPPQKSGAASTSPRYWIVVADTAGAHIYQKSENGIERLADEDACCTHPFPLPDTHVTDRDFLLLLAHWLGEAAREEAFDRLALLGARETLALMRSHLPQDACERVCAALEKDVAEIRENEIEDHIISVVWV